ncbi:MAG: methyltransferase domain-containing protein [Bacillota bacterium]|nr:methyltransferase domain-containing protein [Bacillota bacterium]
MSERHERLERIFDRWAASYGRSPMEDGLFVGYRRSLEGAAALARMSAGMRVLDVGIGTGALAERLAARGAQIWGIDISSRMLERCREHHPEFRLQSGHFLEIPFADGLFERVVSSFAFHHLVPGEYRRAFTEVLRVMVPGGRFVIADIMFASEEERQAARDRLAAWWDEEEVYPLVPCVAAAAWEAGAAGVESHRLGWLHWAVTGSKPDAEGQREGSRGGDHEQPVRRR